jgi:hypothetical protein
MAHLAIIPENLGRIADYAGKNWLELMLAPFMTLNKFVAELNKSIIAFVKNPTGGLQFDFSRATEDLQRVLAKAPELAKPILVDVTPQINELTDNIVRKELKRSESPEKGFVPPPPGQVKPAPAAAALPKPEEAKKEPGKESVKFAGAAELASKEGYKVLINGLTGRSKGTENLEKLGNAQLAELKKLNANAPKASTPKPQTKTVTI